MSEKELENYRKKVQLRNLKRTLAKLSSHPDLNNEYYELKQKIEDLENQLQ